MALREQKAFKGTGMEGWLARWYARTRRHDMEDFRRQAKGVADRLPLGGNVLEVAPGPGYFAIELSKLGQFAITGLDISRSMVDIAEENAAAEGVAVDFQQGNASAMPFAEESFDFVYCAAAFKNFAEPVRALDEMHRVLRPGGRALIFDLTQDASMDEIDAMARQSGRNRFDAWITRNVFRYVLLKRAYSEADFGRLAEESRFGSCEVTKGAGWLEVNLKKLKCGAPARSIN
jgi:ubiquinone/menaquinone biosynthesis C-methylase UbiE